MISTALFCMALNVYHESRGEEKLGQYAVAMVTMNRAKERNKPICEVVTERKQFSWTINGLQAVKDGKKFIGYQLKKTHIPQDMKAWEQAVAVSKMVMTNKVTDITYGANHYHTPTAPKKRWMNERYVVAVIGNHIFYRLS